MGSTARRHAASRRLLAFVLALALLVVAFGVSLAVGARPVSIDAVVRALLGGEVDAADANAVVGLRLPRSLVAIAVGSGLGVAGAVIQALTRNPLADPGVLGVTSGSGFAVAMTIVATGITSPGVTLVAAFVGALVATVVVAAIGSDRTGGADPVRLVLAGVAIGAVLAGIVAGLRLIDPRSFFSLQVWESGRLEDRGLEVMPAPVLVLLVAGLVLALLLTPSLNAVALGDDVATAQGANVPLTRVGSVAAITLLAGSATAMAGPIGFVGLMVPHLARRLVGPDQRWLVPLAAVLGPSLVLLADVVARIALQSGELPVGVVLAFVGAPVLIALAMRRDLRAL